MKTTISLAILITTTLATTTAQAATGEGQVLLNSIDTPGALQGFRLSESEIISYNQEAAATEVCITNARRAYRKSKKRAANKAMRDRWEVMLRFVRDTSKEGQVFTAMEPELLAWANNLERLTLNEDLTPLTKTGPAFIRQNLALEKRFGPGWGCRLSRLMIKSKKPLATKKGQQTKEAIKIFYRAINLSEKAYLKQSEAVYKLGEDNSIVDGYLEEDYQASEDEVAWFRALLTEPIGLLNYVRTD